MATSSPATFSELRRSRTKADLKRRLAEAEHELATLRGGPKAERAKAWEPQPQRSTGRL
jgi:hypothetical protein